MRKKYLQIFILAFLVNIVLFISIASAQGLTTDKFIDDLRSRVQNFYGVKPQDVIIIYKDIELEERLKNFGNSEIELKIKDSVLNMIAGKENLPVDVYLDGKYKTLIFLKVKVDVYKEIFLTSAYVKRGEILSEQNIKKERKNLSSIPNNIIYNADNIYGNEALRDLAPNTPISGNVMKIRPAILRGEIVTLKIKSRNLTLVGQGEALEDGYIGKNIKVKVINFLSNKIVSGKVIGRSEVQIEINE